MSRENKRFLDCNISKSFFIIIYLFIFKICDTRTKEKNENSVPSYTNTDYFL